MLFILAHGTYFPNNVTHTQIQLHPEIKNTNALVKELKNKFL